MERSIYSKDMMSDYATVVDVYDSAAVIGKDFEYLIEQYGVEAVTELMPKVIRVLEQLEYLAAKNEKDSEEVHQLQATISRLECDKEERNKERAKYEQELEQIEETWRKESKELLQMVSNLQEQNKRLQERLKYEKSEGQKAAVEKREEESQVIESLRETIHRQRKQIKHLEQDIKQKEVDVEAMQGQVERLARDNAALRSLSNESRAKANELLAQQASLEYTIQEKEDQIKNIRDTITQREKNIDTSDMSKIEDRVNLIGKMVGDLKDPNRPRFTLSELKEVLMERNTLKSQLIEVEEELAFFKSSKPSGDQADAVCGWEGEKTTLVIDEDDECTGDVQGPINQEPWEKLYGNGRKPESGIRKFFERFPVELPDTIRVNIVSGELADYAQSRASSFWDLRATPKRIQEHVGHKTSAGRPKSEHLSSAHETN